VIGVQALPFLPSPKLVKAHVFRPADDRYGNVMERPRVIAGRFAEWFASRIEPDKAFRTE
jgi:hypothetical protein